MNAYHSSAIFIDGYRKGLRDFDVEKAYEGVQKNLMEGTFIPWRQGTPRRPIDDFYHEHGFFPALRPGQEETEPQMDGFEKRQPVAVTLGISYDFWALSELAENWGKRKHMRNMEKGRKTTGNSGILSTGSLCPKTRRENGSISIRKRTADPDTGNTMMRTTGGPMHGMYSMISRGSPNFWAGSKQLR
jgi:putative alpha-1,2-mannosidase